MGALRKENRKSRTPHEESLATLSANLREIEARGLLSQVAIQRMSGVDQPTISRARAGKLKRVTEKVRLLNRCVEIQLKTRGHSLKIRRATEYFYAAGGSEDELLASINLATRLLLSRSQ